MVDGVEVPPGLSDIREAWKRCFAGQWVLETEGGERIAVFESESELVEWWKAFRYKVTRQLDLGLEELKHLPFKLHDRTVSPKTPAQAQQKDRKKKRKKAGRAFVLPAVGHPKPIDLPVPHATHSPAAGHTTSDYMKPLSEKYDMPEYDIE